MIARVNVIGTSLLLLSAQVAFGADPAERSARLTKQAKEIVTEIDQGHYEKVEARFDKTMADALPLDKLTATSASIAQQAGALKSIGETTTSMHEGYFVVVMQCKYANAALDAQVAFDGDDKVAGLYFRPHAAPAG